MTSPTLSETKPPFTADSRRSRCVTGTGRTCDRTCPACPRRHLADSPAVLPPAAARWIQSILMTAMLVVMLTGWSPLKSEAGWTRSEVYFGMSVPGGGAVTPDEWQDFINGEITPRFPAGLTILDTTGQWRETSGTIAHEPGKLLVLLHPNDPEHAAAIEEIRRLYCDRFHQEAVMKVNLAAGVSF